MLNLNFQQSSFDLVWELVSAKPSHLGEHVFRAPKVRFDF